MRITFFVNQSLESPAGIGRYFPIAKELTKKGHKISIIALHHDYKSLKEKSFVKDGINVYYVGQMHVLKKGNKKIYMNKPQLIKTIITSILKMCMKGLALKTDAVYIFKPQPPVGTAALITSFFKRKKLFVDCDDYEAESNTFSTKIEKKAFAFFENFLPKRAAKVTTHNTFLMQRLKDLGVKNIVYLPNGVEKDFAQGTKTFGSKKVLYFGSISLKSGHSLDLLLEAFKIVRQHINSAELVLVGGGEDIDEIKKIAGEAVTFTGRLPRQELIPYIQAADITVEPAYDSPANRARFPIKIVESMAAATPVIATDVGDRKKIIEGAGMVTAPNAEDLAQAIIHTLNDKALLHQMSQECLKNVKKYYWEEVCGCFDNFFDSNKSRG